jgi:hypothetical protein
LEQTKLQAHLEHGAPWQVDGKGVAYVWGVLIVVEHVRADQEETQKQEGAGPAKKEMMGAMGASSRRHAFVATPRLLPLLSFCLSLHHPQTPHTPSHTRTITLAHRFTPPATPGTKNNRRIL